MRRAFVAASFAAALITLPTLSFAQEATSGAAAGAVTGGVVGGVVGGPVGAAVGAGVGGTVGAAAGESSERNRERVIIEERAPRRETTCVEGSTSTTCVTR